jgi:hypothetical protein
MLFSLFLVQIFFVLLQLFRANADLSGFWSSQDIKRISREAQKTLSTATATSKDIFFALQLIGVSQSLEDYCKCDRFERPSTNLNQAYYGLKINEICGCNHKISSEIISSAQIALTVSDS